ncbi:MAG TPA: type II toxin-antitoxin system HicA family toxin [Sphingomicrobium sp.]|nr:type II toxin-antitoxin system HicA family toxin [Sphingomicrobium sp.]
MVQGYGKLVKRILREHGFELLRSGKGDHEIWWNPQTKRQVTVDGGTRSRYTAQETLKQAGIKVRV